MRCKQCNHRRSDMVVLKRLPDDEHHPDFYRHLRRCNKCKHEQVSYQRKPHTMTNADAFLAQHGYDRNGNDKLAR